MVSIGERRSQWVRVLSTVITVAEMPSAAPPIAIQVTILPRLLLRSSTGLYNPLL